MTEELVSGGNYAKTDAGETNIFVLLLLKISRTRIL